MPQYFLPITGISNEEHGADLVRCEGTIPVMGGLRSLPKPFPEGSVGDLLSSAYIHQYPSGWGSAAYVGDAPTELYASQTQIYEYSGGVMTDILTGALTGTAPRVRFASFGRDVWATNGIDPVKRRTNNTGNFASGITSAFAPKARFIDPVRDFMILADINDAAYGPHWFAWSDFQDATYYSPPDATRPSSLAGRQPILSRPGQIMGFVGGEYGTFWKRNSMHLLSFVGGDDIWRLEEISPSVGTPFPDSIVCCRDGVKRFWGGDGFYAQAGSSAPSKIGGTTLAALLIDRESYASTNAIRPLASFSDMSEEDRTMFGVEDPEMGGIFWFYRGEDDDPALGNSRWLFYDYLADTYSLGVGVSIPDPAGGPLDTIAARYTAAAANRSFLSTETKQPRFIVGAIYDTATAMGYRFRFASSTFHAITLATQRFAIEKGEGELARHVRIDAVQPVVTPRQVDYSPSYTLEAPPSDMSIRIVSSNDPYHRPQLDSLSAGVSPRSESRSWSEANDTGWLGFVGVEGYQFLVEITVPEGATALRGLKGLWLHYEVLD